MIIVMTTTETREDAEKIASFLLENKMAACVQIFPVTSKYWWKGNLNISEEFLCLIKTKEELYEEIEQSIKEIHPYETPEITAVPVLKGSKEYLAWLDEVMK